MTIAQPPSPRTRRFTRDEYHQMADLGFFENQRVELIDGEIVEMAAQHERHVWAVSQLIAILAPRIAPPFVLRCQAPLGIDNSEPEPDIAVTTLSALGQDAPRVAGLVIEVSDSSLATDRLKSHLYASVQVPDYWLINLIDRRVERFTEPIADPAALHSSRYRIVTNHAPASSILPIAVPIGPVPLATLFDRQ